MDESIGLITAANEVVNDPSSVGTALKTLTLRLRGSKTELEEMGEDVTDMATTTSQLQAKLLALTGGQVDIMLDENTFKNSTQILREMAGAWENMNDIQRASALELMGGKRQANVLSALIQNFDTVEEAIEASANSAGSALKENERYLDSIQGKIDQFSNAMQAMWSSILDSDMVKGIVALGTELIKIIDKIGLLTTALIAFGAYKGFGAVFGTLKDAGISIDFITKKLGSYLFGINTVTAAENTLTQAQVAKKLTQRGLTAEQAQAIAVQKGLATSTANLSRETLIASLQAQGYQQAEAEKIATEIFGATVTEASTAELLEQTIVRKLSTSGLIQFAVQMKLATAEEVANMGVTQLLTLGFKGLTTAVWSATKAIIKFLFTNPVGWIILAIGAIAGGIAIFAHFHKTTEELTEELNELKSELQDLQSELKNVNSELETTEDRMAELLAMDSLSFTEKEELENLQKQNDELQRKLDLLELQEKQMKKETANKFVETMQSDVNNQSEYFVDTDGTKKVNLLTYFAEGGLGTRFQRVSESDHIESQIRTYQNMLEELADVEKQIIGAGGEHTATGKVLAKRKQRIEKEVDQIESYMNGKITEFNTNAETLDYGINDETDGWLDYISNIQDSWAIASGGKNAETNAIKRIFNKDENSAVSESIDEYVAALRNGDISAKSSIENIIKNNKDLVADLEASGLSVDKAVDYFTSFASELEFATIDGKIEEVSRAATTFESLINGGLFKVDDVDIGLADLFDEEGKIVQTKLSQVFQGTSEQTRKDITHLLEGSYDQIKNGTVDIERLLSGFALKTTQQVLDIQNKVLGEQNLELFPNLKDEIDGIIDKFSEFSAAVGSVVDALDTLEQARAEEAYSGSISIETLENLMKYTDDYAQLVEIDETGAIRLAADAEQILIEQRLQKIKTDAAAAVQTAQANLAQAEYNAKAVNETGPVQEALTSTTDALAGAWAYLGSLLGDVTGGNFGGMFERASTAYGNVTAGREEKRAQVNVSVEDAEEALANALNQQKVANALTSDNVKSKYSADEASGGNDTKEEAEKDLVEDGWKKLLAEYENKLALITNERDLIEAEIDRMEAQGGKASAQYYEDLIRNSAEEKALLEEKLAAQQAYLEDNKGNIDQDTWTEYNNEINETAVAIKECEVNTIEWAEAIREIDLHYFEQITDEVSRLGEELDFVNSLLEDEEVADENGNWSSAALTRMGLYTQQMEKAAAEAAMYQDELDKVNEQYNEGALSEEQYQEKLSDLVSGQQDAIQSYEDAKDSIVEMNEARIDAIKEGIEKEIEAYEDLIDAKKEELDAERDLHDFRENIKNQTKEISELERRIASLSGSSAASDVAERRRLEAQLMEAKEGLNDTYYDHSRDAQSAALDEENEAYALSKEKYIERLEEQLKDTETLISNSIMDVMFNADTVYNELNTMADTYGVTLSDELTQPWKDASAQAIKWKDELKLSMTSGEYASLIGEGGAVTAFANGVATKLQGSWTKAQTAAKNYAGYLTGAELKNRFTSTLTGFGNQIQTIIDKWNGVKFAADAAYAAQTRKVTVGGAGSGDTGDSGSGSGSGSGSDGRTAPKKYRATATLKIGTKTLTATGTAETESKAIDVAKTNMANEYYKYYTALDYDDAKIYSLWSHNKARVKTTANQYAKGTTGTTRDEWAITDEPKFGDELVLIPGKDGNLSFVRKGTGIVPADMTQKLFELAQIPTSDLMSKNLTAIVPNITKNDFKNEFNFESLVHVDTVDSDTLPKLEKMVDKKIDDFSKALNYSIKRFAR